MVSAGIRSAEEGTDLRADYRRCDGKRRNGIHHLQKSVQIIKVNKKLTDVNLQPGDIIGWRDIVHTNIYVGKNGKGQKLWLDGGSAGTRRGRVRRYYSADKIKTFSYLNKHKVSFIIRIKGL